MMLDIYQDVRFAERAPHSIKTHRKKLVREGLKFEANALSLIQDAFPTADCFPSKWIAYRDSEGCHHHAQPDLFIIAGSSLIIFECKLRHTPASCSQLFRYRELLAQLFPSHEIHLVEVFKYMDWVEYPAPTYELQLPFPLGQLRGDAVGLLNLYV